MALGYRGGKESSRTARVGRCSLRGSPSFGGVSEKSVGHPHSRATHLGSLAPHCTSLSKTGTRCTSTSSPKSATASRVRATSGGDTLYAVLTEHWLTHPSPHMKTALGLPDNPASASPLPVRPNQPSSSISRRRDLSRVVLGTTTRAQEAHSRGDSGVPMPRARASRGADPEALQTASTFARLARGRSGREASRASRTRFRAHAAAGAAHPLLGPSERGGQAGCRVG